MKETKIEWTGTLNHEGILQPGCTFNPWIGCTKVSPACLHCYAESEDKRRGWTDDGWGPGKPRHLTSAAYWKQPLKWNEQARAAGIRRKVFCASLADVFDAEVDQAWRNDLWVLIRATPNLDWLVLTKRPENIPVMLPADWGAGYPNVWLGTSVENQYYADQRIPLLTAVPAVIHFLSVEPLLGPIQFQNLHDVEWVIVGGESGHGARPMPREWVLAIRDQLEAVGVPFFLKQWGEFGEDGIKVGKKNAGHLLGGETFHEFPVVVIPEAVEIAKKEIT